MKIHGAISPRTEVAVLTVRAFKSLGSSVHTHTHTLLFPMIRNVLVVQLDLCEWSSGVATETEQRLSALKCDKFGRGSPETPEK